MLAYLMPLLIRVLRPSSFPTRGPFHLGRFSYACCCLGSAFGIFVCVLFVLPTYRDVNALNMNYAVVAVGAILLLVAAQYVVWRSMGWHLGMQRSLREQRALARDDAKKM